MPSTSASTITKLILSALVLIFVFISTAFAHTYTTGAWGRAGETARMRSPQGEMHGSGRVNCATLYRLTSETITGGTASGLSESTTWTHDAVGNRLSQTSSIPGVANQAHTYTTGAWERSGETARMRSPEGETHGSARVNCSANDRLVSDTYDANGNTTAATLDGTNVTDVYDYRNRLVERTTTDGKTIRITYDGDGHRVREAVKENGITTTTEFLVDSLNPTGYAQVVEEIVQGTVTTVYSYGHDLISQDVRQPGAFVASFYTYDGHGSVRQLTDALGTVTDAYTYDAFGVLIDSHGPTANRYLFAGEQFVPSLGLYHNRTRYLNAANGRFWSMDVYEGPVMEPATLHKYLYAHGDPVNGVDPSGYAGSFNLSGISTITTIASSIYKLPSLALRSMVGTGLQTYKVAFVSHYTLGPAMALKIFSKSQFQRARTYAGAGARAIRLMNYAGTLESLWFKALANAPISVLSSIALGPMGLIYNVINVGVDGVAAVMNLASIIDNFIYDMHVEAAKFPGGSQILKSALNSLPILGIAKYAIAKATPAALRFLLKGAFFQIDGIEIVEGYREALEGIQDKNMPAALNGIERIAHQY